MSTAQKDATILVVDDDEVSIMAMQRVFKKLGIANETLIARDGQQALQRLDDTGIARNNTCIVVLDVNMPVMNGWEFLEFVRDRFDSESVAVLLQGSVEFAGESVSARSKHVVGHLCKDDPVNSWQAVIAENDFVSGMIRYHA